MITTSHAILKFAKNLENEPPRSPRERLGGYAIVGRTIDKCRAHLMNQLGDYHFNCPLDQMFFQFTGIDANDFVRAVKDGLTDEELVQWINDIGVTHSPEEIQKWSDDLEKYSLINNPEKKDYFIKECKKLRLNPEKTTLFEWLEADDRASFKRKA
jgi:hypothetical protein